MSGRELDALIEQMLEEDREVKSPEPNPALRHPAAFWTNHTTSAHRMRAPNLWNPPTPDSEDPSPTEAPE